MFNNAEINAGSLRAASNGERAEIQPRRLWRLTAAVLIAEFVLVLACTFVLASMFEFPAILREPAGKVLNLFNQNSGIIRAAYYFFAWSSILMILLVILVHKVLARRDEDNTFLLVGTVAGGVAGIVQFLGFIRWPFMVPYLAETYANPQSSEATRAAVTVAYHTFNQYAGVAIGEHLGFVFTAIWGIIIGIAMLKSGLFKPWVGWVGILSSGGIVVSGVEQFGLSYAEIFSTLNLISYTVFLFWLVIMAVGLLRAAARASQN